MGLTSRERVRLALEHKEADRVPIDFGGMRSTGIMAMGYNKLKEYLGMKDGVTKLYDIYQQLAEPEMQMVDRFHGDVVQLHRLEPAFGVNIKEWKDGLLPDGSKCLVPKDFTTVINEFGDHEFYIGDILFAKMPEGGFYFDVVHFPYAECKTKEDIDKIPLPYITDEELVFLTKEAKRLYYETDKAILASFGGNIIEAGEADWGFENFLINAVAEPELIHHYLQRLTDCYMSNLEKYMKAVGQYIDTVQFGDDLGMQDSTLISKRMYRKMIKPYHSVQFQYVKKNYPKVKVFFHSCGAVYDLIPDLIEAGVEVLNPIQLSAKGMDPVLLKENFGDDLVFWGGGIDTQQTLTHCKVEEIEDEVKRLIDIFGKGGGFVFTQVHNIQSNISPQKVVAVYDSAYKHGWYK